MRTMDAAQYEYITSERFIHDDLVRASQHVVDEVCRLWENGHRFIAHAMAWPTRAVHAEDGSAIGGAIVMEIQKAKDQDAALRALVAKTGAYGLLLVEMKETGISARFETAHGACAWTVPIRRHGDRLMLGDQSMTKDAEYIGLLWSPNLGRA